MLTVQVLAKASVAVVDPYADPLTNKTTINNKIEVVIAVDIHCGNAYAKAIRIGKSKRLQSACVA